VAGALRGWLGTPRGPASLGIRPVDVLATAVVIAAVELNNATSHGPSQQPLDALAWFWGAAVAVPVLLRRRWPRGVLVACALLLLIFYSTDRRDITPAPLLCLPLYDAAAAGFLALAIIIPAFYMTVGLFFVGEAAGVLALTEEFLPSLVVLLLAILLGDAVRSRRALAGQAAERLRLAEEEREREGARRVAEERLRIARELHDTVAHSMATIAVQAASALHVLESAPAAEEGGIRAALTAIRETSKGALTDIRQTLGDLRAEDREPEHPDTKAAGLARLEVLCDAVRAAGAPVTVTVQGEPAALPSETDYSAYRILQESLTKAVTVWRVWRNGPPPSVAAFPPVRGRPAASRSWPACRWPSRRRHGDPGPAGRRPGAGPGRVPDADRVGRRHAHRGRGRRRRPRGRADPRAPARRGAHGPAHARGRRGDRDPPDHR
jgi:signal transduction histidine kinase